MHRGKKNYSKRLHRCLVWATAPKAFTGVSVSIHNRAVFRRSLNHAYSSKVLSEVQWAHMPGWECPNTTAEIPGIFFCPWFSLGTLPHSHPQSFPSSFTAWGTYLPWAPEQTDVSHVQENKKKRPPNQQNSLKSSSLCCVVAHGALPCPANPAMTQCCKSYPPVAAHHSACPPEQPKQNWAGQRQKKHNQEAELGDLGPFQSGWSSLKNEHKFRWKTHISILKLQVRMKYF